MVPESEPVGKQHKELLGAANIARNELMQYASLVPSLSALLVLMS